MTRNILYWQVVFTVICLRYFNCTTVTDVYVNNGSTYVLICPFNANDIAWKGPNHEYSIGSEINANLPPNIFNRISIVGVSAKGEFNLQIKDVVLSDEGRYKCEGSPIKVKEFYLVISVPPTAPPIVWNVPYGPIKSGETIQISCAVTGGKPLATIAWECDKAFNQDQSSNTSVIVSSLQLNVSKIDNHKMCSCIASHMALTVNMTANITLDVIYAPDESLIVLQTPFGAIIEGNAVNLTCMLSGGNPLATLSWNCNGTATNNTSGNTASYSVELIVDKTYNNRICTCSATHAITSYRPTIAYTLIVYYVPDTNLSIHQSPSGAIVEGNAVNLTCTVSGGNPLATLSWNCNGTAMNNTIENKASYSVQLIVDKTDNNRICTCSAKHAISSYRPSVEQKLVVHYTPDTSLSIQQTPPGAIISGNNVMLTCRVSGGNPLATLFWSCNGTITNNTSGSTASYSVELIVDKSYDKKICICSAIHPVTSYRPSLQHGLIVYYIPDTNLSVHQTPSGAIFTGHSVTLTCTVSGGNPLATLSWNCNGTASNNTSGNTASYGIEIIVDKTYNNRSCTCSAKHPVITYRPSVQHKITVYYAPDNDMIIKQTPPGAIITGNQVTLVCTLSGGNPLATLSWNCNGTSVNNTSGDTASYSVELIVDKTYNNRTCTCSATHPVLSYRPFVQHGLVVHFPPDVDIVFNKTAEYVEGMKITLTCNTAGNPSPYTYEWKQMLGNTTVRSFVTKPNYLTIHDLSYMDVGTYSCSVDNGIPDGQNNTVQSASTFVEIKFKPIFVDNKPVYSAKIDDNVTIGVNFFSFPDILKPVIWTNATDDALIENENSIFQSLMNEPIVVKFHNATVLVNTFSYVAKLCLSRFQSKYEGFYTLQVTNSIGNNSLSVQIVISGKPQPPKNFAVTTVTHTTVTISWYAGYNGGYPQTFHIKYRKQTAFDDIEIKRPEESNKIEYTLTIPDLIPSTAYTFSIESSNSEGYAAPSKNNTLVVVTDNIEGMSEKSIVAPVAGGLSGFIAATIVVIIIIFYIRKAKGLSTKDHSRGLTECADNIVDEEQDVLKDNILYESAGQLEKGQPVTCGEEYAMVNKTRDKHEGAVNFSTSKKGKSKDNRQNATDDEVYENMKDKFQNDSFAKEPLGNKNKDGLQYADIIFNATSNGGRFVIHGLEDRTIYAEVDTTQKIDPLPESDD